MGTQWRYPPLEAAKELGCGMQLEPKSKFSGLAFSRFKV